MSAGAPSAWKVEVAVVGGGQAGLATGYYLRRAGLRPGTDFVILDAAPTAGGSLPRMWDGLRLFSPSAYSSLPGWMMPPWNDAERGYPPRDHVVRYLTAYEDRYDLAVLRPHRVHTVTRADAEQRRLSPPRDVHRSTRRRGGGGNSAAQVLAEVSRVAKTTWVTTRPPRFLPDGVDGRVLFATATERATALREGREHSGVGGLGDIVMIPSVTDARDRGVLKASRCSTDSPRPEWRGRTGPSSRLTR